MKQTAVEWLVNMWEMQGTITPLDIREAKRIEKEQIFDSFDSGVDSYYSIESPSNPEIYYNKTFNTNEK
jgi:hypothetical protein